MADRKLYSGDINMKYWTRLSLLLILLALLGASVTAQDDAPDQNLGQGFPGSSMDGPGFRMRKEMAANYENLKLLKLLDAVDLTEKQSETFIPLFHGFRSDIKELRNEKRDLFMQLTEVADQPNSDAGIRELLDKIKANKSAFVERQQTFIDDCESLLSIAQVARLVVFQEMFERQVLESLREFRRGRGPHSPKGKQGKI